MLDLSSCSKIKHLFLAALPASAYNTYPAKNHAKRRHRGHCSITCSVSAFQLYNESILVHPTNQATTIPTLHTHCLRPAFSKLFGLETIYTLKIEDP